MGNLISGIKKYGDSTISLSLYDLLADLSPQLCIDALSTVTPHMADLLADVPSKTTAEEEISWTNPEKL